MTLIPLAPKGQSPIGRIVRFSRASWAYEVQFELSAGMVQPIHIESME